MALALLLLVAAPAVARAGWSAPERVRDFSPPGAEVVVVRPVQPAGLLTVKVRGHAAVAVPESEYAVEVDSAVGPGA